MLKNVIPQDQNDEYPKDWSEHYIVLTSMLKQFHDAKLAGDERRARFILTEADFVMLELRRANAA